MFDDLSDQGHCLACGVNVPPGLGQDLVIGQQTVHLCWHCACDPDRAAARALKRAKRAAALFGRLVDLSEELDEMIRAPGAPG